MKEGGSCYDRNTSSFPLHSDCKMLQLHIDSCCEVDFTQYDEEELMQHIKRIMSIVGVKIIDILGFLYIPENKGFTRT